LVVVKGRRGILQAQPDSEHRENMKNEVGLLPPVEGARGVDQRNENAAASYNEGGDNQFIQRDRSREQGTSGPLNEENFWLRKKQGRAVLREKGKGQ